MKLAENVVKFQQIVKSHPTELSQSALHDVARAIIMADTCHWADEDRGKYERLTLADLSACRIAEFAGVCRGGKPGKELTDVMQMRIMCDVLTLLLGGSYQFAMRYSSDVARAVKGDRRQAVTGYLDYDSCETILNGHLDNSGSFDELLRPVFKQTSELLDGLHQVRLVADKGNRVVTSTCVKGVWLPDEYKSAGFEVSTKMPSSLKSAEGDMTTLVSMYNFACIMDVLVRAITRTRTDQAACSLFVARIDEMCSLSKDLVPIGTKVTMGVHPSVYSPNHFLINDTIRVMYRRLFSDGDILSVDSVRNTIQVILRYYRARTGGM